MSDINIGWKFTQNRNSVYVAPEAIKEFEQNIKGDRKIKKHYFSLINLWIESDSHPPQSICKKIKEDIYRLKKGGTQARFLGYYKNSDFFVLKCIKKKQDRLDERDINTTIKRKGMFNEKNIKWKEKS